VPPELLESAPQLTPLPDDKNTLADLLENATDNYAQYYILRDRYETWQNWYNTQQKIYQDATQ
jgi:hypothetical protein